MVGIITIVCFIFWFVNHHKKESNAEQTGKVDSGLGTRSGYREDYIRGYQGLPERELDGRGEVTDGGRGGYTP